MQRRGTSGLAPADTAPALPRIAPLACERMRRLQLRRRARSARQAKSNGARGRAPLATQKSERQSAPKTRPTLGPERRSELGAWPKPNTDSAEPGKRRTRGRRATGENSSIRIPAEDPTKSAPHKRRRPPPHDRLQLKRETHGTAEAAALSAGGGEGARRRTEDRRSHCFPLGRGAERRERAALRGNASPDSLARRLRRARVRLESGCARAKQGPASVSAPLSSRIPASAASRTARSRCGRAAPGGSQLDGPRVLRQFAQGSQNLLRRLFCGASDDDRAPPRGSPSAPGARRVNSTSASPAATPLVPETLARSPDDARVAGRASIRRRACPAGCDGAK